VSLGNGAGFQGRSADDAALGRADRFDQHLDLWRVAEHGFEALQRDIKGQVLAVENLEGAAQLADRANPRKPRRRSPSVLMVLASAGEPDTVT
jgi:hypothetical protein